MDATLALIRPHMGSCRRPGTYDKVYNAECIYSYETPFSSGGIYVSLSNWQGVGPDFLSQHSEATGSKLYLHIKKTRVLKPKEDGAPEPTTMDQLLQASLPENKFDITENLAVVVVVGGGAAPASVPFPHEEIPMVITDCAQAVASQLAAGDAEEVATSVEDEEVPESKHYADLPWQQNGTKISPDPSKWECAESGMKENLWLNLSTGHIGSGRRQWDGSGGTDGALNHFVATGKQYPLAVKLGTITPSGADVYSYAEDEDRMVKDPKLAEHLARWGINIMELEKTDKTLAELQFELNKSHDFNAITEAGAKLVPVAGPGLTGLTNLGNSCYMNSTLQLLLLPPGGPLACRFGGERGGQLLSSAPVEEVPSDVLAQLSKVTRGVLSGAYAVSPEASKDPTATDGSGSLVRPQMFKSVVGRGHAEFSSGRQQDAVEYLEHLLKVVSRAEFAAGPERYAFDQFWGVGPLASSFEFTVQQRLVCTASQTVRYREEPGTVVLRLNIPLEQAVNKDEVEGAAQALKKAKVVAEQEGAAAAAGDAKADGESKAGEESSAPPVLPRVPLSACLAAWAAEEAVPDFRSPALGGAVSPAVKSERLRSMPPFLLVQAQRYTTDASWQPKKLEVLLDVPDTLDLEFLRAKPDAGGSPLQPGETAMPEEPEGPAGAAGGAAAGDAAPVTADEGVVAQLVSMGFSENGCRRAAVATGNNPDAAMEWVLAHMEDADFNDPPSSSSAPAGGADAPGAGANAEAVSMLTSMGFSDEHVVAALGACNQDSERAADWLFSHADDLPGAVAALSGASAGAGSGSGGGGGRPPADGPGVYKLRGFVSHIGKNTGAGHYVCHGLKKVPADAATTAADAKVEEAERWVIFNDSSVALSENPPREHAYMYLYERAA